MAEAAEKRIALDELIGEERAKQTLDREALTFDQLVFSGGGTRCFWHGGFLEVVGPKIHLEPKRVSAVSGGALSATAFLAGVEDRLVEVMGRTLGEREKNFSTTWNEVQENGLTPHQEMYRDIVSEVLDDEVLEKIASGPSFEVLLAHPPIDTFPEASTLPLIAAYEADLAIRSTPHVIAPEEIGANNLLVDARHMAREGRLVDLLCAAAVIPPVFNVQHWDNRPVIDGGMTSKAPMPTKDEGNTLILLTRRFRNLPVTDNKLFVQPSESVPADKIDFTSREKLERTWDAGHEDGEAFAKSCDL